LKPHPKNYRKHPDDQLEHIVRSIEENGMYRNVVVANDNTILAGHGVVLAAKQMHLATIPVVKLDIDADDQRALKIITGDNEIAHLGIIDDRALTELLKEIYDGDSANLVGTGYDEQMIANLAMVSRTQSEIADFNEAAEWLGMPEYEQGGGTVKIVIHFLTQEDRIKYVESHDIRVSKKSNLVWSMWWPERERADLTSTLIDG